MRTIRFILFYFIFTGFILLTLPGCGSKTDGNALTNTESVAEDVFSLQPVLGGGNPDLSNVTASLTLPSTGENDTTITWSSDNTSVIANDGTVTRPATGSANATVTLTATITKGSVSQTKTFTIIVLKEPASAADALTEAQTLLTGASLTYGTGESASAVTTNITLPSTGANGTTIVWSEKTDTGSNISISGTTAAVTRPIYSSSNANIELTATITNSSGSLTKDITLTILKSDPTPVEAINAAKAALTESNITFTASETSATVKNNFTLPLTGSLDTTISWTSANSAVSISGASATVTRAASDVTGNITATISKAGGASQTKDFSIKVLADLDTADVAADKAALADTTIKGSNTDLDNVKVNLYLPGTGSGGSGITWSSDKPGVIANDGTVTRPASTASDETVVMTATITKGSATDTKPFTIKVIKLSATSYSITFNINGGISGSMENQMIDSGSSAILSANAFIRSGYLFSGWATTSTGGVAYNDKQSFTMGGANVQLYAVWTLSSSLLIKYDFNSQNCNDSSVNAKNGTPNNITYISDGNGGYSASFNGTSSYIVLPDNTIRGNSAFTVMMRFKTSTNTNALLGYQITAAGVTDPSQFVPIIWVDTAGKLVGDLWNGSAHFTVTSAAAVTDNTWHSVYFSAKTGSIALYLDGIQIGISESSVDSLSMTFNQIGAANLVSPAGWHYFNGLIDDFYFYSTALH